MLRHEGPFQDFDVNRLEAQLVKRDRRRLYIAFGAALLLHASTVVGFTFWTPPEPIAPPGDMVVTIDLAPAMLSSDQGKAGTAAQNSAESEAQPEPVPEEQETAEPPEPEPPEPVKEQEVVEEPPPEPVKEEAVEEPAPQPVQEAEIVQENIEEPPPAEEPVVALSPKKVEQPQKQVKKKKKQQTAMAASQAANSASTQRSDVSGSGAMASPTEINKYAGLVRSAIERKKRTPAGSGKGIVYVSFTITRSGAITGLRLTRSSGDAALDAAARSSVMEASIPPIPESLPGTMPFGVPIRFN